MQTDARQLSQDPVMIARAMFQKTVSNWAGDVLALRKRGWDRPCLRLTRRVVVRRPKASGRRRAA